MKGNKERLDICGFAGLEKQLISTQFVKDNLRRPLSDEDMMARSKLRTRPPHPIVQTWEIISESILPMHIILKSIQFHNKNEIVIK